jgi:hypothetical protein
MLKHMLYSGFAISPEQAGMGKYHDSILSIDDGRKLGTHMISFLENLSTRAPFPLAETRKVLGLLFLLLVSPTLRALVVLNVVFVAIIAMRDVEILKRVAGAY